MFRRILLFTLGTFLAISSTASARTLFVDNRMGDDIYDGLNARVVNEFSGPFRTIHRALIVARNGDEIQLINRGVPYYESISLGGNRIGLSETVPFQIFGNGCIVSGARPIPPEAWELVGEDLWRFNPRRKTYFQLLRDEQAVPAYTGPRVANKLPDLPAGQWTDWRGAIYYRALPQTAPPEEPFQFAANEVGLTLYNVRGVEIHNLTFRHFRLDGINAHDLCRNVLLQDVHVVENGRAGLAVGGTSQVIFRGGSSHGNRVEDVLVTELGAAEVLEAYIGIAPPPPTPGDEMPPEEMPSEEMPAEPAAEGEAPADSPPPAEETP